MYNNIMEKRIDYNEREILEEKEFDINQAETKVNMKTDFLFT